MLHFPDMQSAQNSIDDIKSKHSAHIDSVDFYAPSKCFENNFRGFISLRMKIETLRNNWLNTPDADPSSDPDDSYMPGIGFRTVLNSEGAVKIGSIIFYFRPNGDYYKVEDGNFNKYSPLLSSKNTSTNLDSVFLYSTNGNVLNMKSGSSTIQSQSSSLSCIGWQQKNKTNNYASNRRVKVKIWVWNYGPIGADVDSETENFRRTSGVWFRNSANEINSGLCGQIVGGNCFFIGNICPPLKVQNNSSGVGNHLSIYGGLVRKVESKKLTASGRARTGNVWSQLLNVQIE